MEGNEAVARGAMAAGCSFFAGYPITPANHGFWPVPEKLLKEKAKAYKRIVVIEVNLGQYVNEIRRVLAGKKLDFYGQMDGTLIAPGKIMEVIDNE